MIKTISKVDARANYISNIAKAMQLNKKTSPTLFSTERLGVFSLYNCWFGCCIWKQLNKQEVKQMLIF